jgi:ribosome-associated protein
METRTWASNAGGIRHRQRQVLYNRVHKLAHYLADLAKRELDDRDLTSRSDLRREQKQSERAYTDLASALCDCTKKQFERLVLDEELRRVVVEARRIESPAAKERALRLVRRELRSGDSEAIKRQLDALKQPGPTKAPEESERWVAKLLTEGDEALSAFVSAHPNADRRRLRQLVVQAKKAPGTSGKPNAALLKCVAEALVAIAAEPDPE